MQKVRAEIRLDHIRNNAEYFAERAKGAAMCAVVKADAYGHGAAAVAQTLRNTADCFAVSLVEEGAQLRHAGTEKDILVLTPPLSEEEVVRGAAEDLIFTVGDARDYALLVRVCEKFGLVARCHVKANTGMNRYGFSYAGFCRFSGGKLSDRVAVEGIYSHFYRPEDAQTTEAQFVYFTKFSEAAEKVFGRLTKHISATGGVLASLRYRLDMVRIGIGLYGYVPGGFSDKEGALKPAMRVYAQVASERKKVFGGAGYGKTDCPNGRLCTVRAGYADGFWREGAEGSVNVLCMDAYVARNSVSKYGYIELLTDADAYAQAHGTISYEVLVRMGGRAERVYVECERGTAAGNEAPPCGGG